MNKAVLMGKRKAASHRHRWFAASCALCLLFLPLASCGSPQASNESETAASGAASSISVTAADGTVFVGPHASDFAQAYANATTDVFRSVVKDGQLSLADDDALSSAYHSCVFQFPEEQTDSSVHLTQAATMIALTMEHNFAISMSWDNRVTLVSDDIRNKAIEESAQCATATEIDKLDQLAQTVDPLGWTLPLPTDERTMYVYAELYSINGLTVPQGTLTQSEFEKQILGKEET